MYTDEDNMPATSRHPGARTLEELRRRFEQPHIDSRPTPFFWWSGGDVDRDRLTDALDQLAAKGIAGTIVGYSQHPDNRLDAGSPEPFSDEWWELLRWFCDESARRGMVVGVQDYGIIGSVLLGIGDETSSLHGGTLVESSVTVSGPCFQELPVDPETLLSARGWALGQPEVVLDHEITRQGVRWSVPEGEWVLSAVTVQPGEISGTRTRFDPLHPESGALVISRFYETFQRKLGDRLGNAFRFIFQDELNLGVIMPMFDQQLGALLQQSGFDLNRWLSALWHDLGSRTIEFRAAYRDAVVGLLEAHYFRPIFEWHRAHGTQMLMDQLSRGDLRLGARHYGDFLDVMRWYDGPGNDDPDLTGPRNIAAFIVSSSIANLSERPYVPNEAFHSSGWGVTPQLISAGAAVGFAAGANHLILHGLDHTTNGGWWEWASPDFHFRQPWWQHSAGLWDSLSRTTEFVRAGSAARNVAVVDPSSDVALSGQAVNSPELAHRLLESLALAGIETELVPPSLMADATVDLSADGPELRVQGMSYRAVVLPGIVRLRDATAELLLAFAEAGGLVAVVSQLPDGTELRDLDAAQQGRWKLTGADELPQLLRSSVRLDVVPGTDGVIASHRCLSDADAFLLVNTSEDTIRPNVELHLGRRVSEGASSVELWDPWTGDAHTLPTFPSHDGGLGIELELRAGESALIVVGGDTVVGSLSGTPVRPPELPSAVVELDGPWTFEVTPSLDNSFGDFAVGGGEIGVPTWRLEEASISDGPWTEAQVDSSTRFHVLGPIPAGFRDAADTLVASLRAIVPDSEVRLGDIVARWRPYRFSEKTGIVRDPLLLDRMTGPHGLKGVPDEFLDPTVLDAEVRPGDSYYFWTSVTAGGGRQLIEAASRAAYMVWFDNAVVIQSEHEDAAAFHPPWGLRDMSTTPIAVEAETDIDAAVPTVGDRPPLAVRVVVAQGQPTRLAVRVGGTPPETPDPALMRWWQGPQPSRHFEPVMASPAGPSSVWLRTIVPPGGTAVRVEVDGTVIGASVAPAGAPSEAREPAAAESRTPVAVARHATSPTPTAVDEWMLTLPESASHAMRVLTFEVQPHPTGSADAGVLRGPLQWQTSPQLVALRTWPELGLADYSGLARYTTDFSVPPGSTRATLTLGGLSGTARVEVNGTTVGHILQPGASLLIDTSVLRASAPCDRNSIVIEVANTLSNHYAHLPSPYSAVQPPSGGFLSGRLDVS
jgi:hypothetical protein